MSFGEITNEAVDALLDAYPRDRRHALAVMQDMQRQFGYVPREGLEALAIRLGRPLAELCGVATFYKALSLKPKGRRVIKVCDGTACHIRGSVNLINAIQRTLGIAPSETTPDGDFSLETVNCLGACALAPVMTIGDKYYGKVAVDSLPVIFEELRAELPRDGEKGDEPARESSSSISDANAEVTI